MKRWILAGLAGGIIAVFMGLPLAWVGPHVLKQDGLEFSGTVWDGHVKGLPGFQNLSLRIRPTQLLGQTPAKVIGAGDMRLSSALGLHHVKDLMLSLPIRALPLRDTRLQGLAGIINVSVDAAEFDLTKGCTSVTGSARTDVLSTNAARLKWQGPILSGPLVCENGNVIANLSGRDDQGQVITAYLTLRPDGKYLADIEVQTSLSEAAAIMPLFGFAPVSQNQYKLSEQGQWR